MPLTTSEVATNAMTERGQTHCGWNIYLGQHGEENIPSGLKKIWAFGAVDVSVSYPSRKVKYTLDSWAEFRREGFWRYIYR